MTNLRSMTPGEIISASIAGVALIVACLARLDSKKSADAAQRSADAAQRVTELMARQVELATNEQNRKVQKEISESVPRFDWRGGMDSPMGGVCEREFQNMGGEVTNLAIEVETKEITATMHPVNILQHHGVGNIRFAGKAGRSHRPIDFKISCLTKLGERWEKAFKMVGERDLKIVEV